MARTQPRQAMSAQDFLVWESSQSLRHEFGSGEVFAMAGVEDRHVTVALNLAMALRQHLAGTPCRTSMSDMKLQSAAGNCFFYPDVLVTCSATDQASPYVKSEPRLLIEVLSPSTAAYDRGEKFAHYRDIASLQELVLVDIDTRRSDVYRRGQDGLWVLHPFDAGQTVSLASVDLTIDAERLFAEVEAAPPRSA